MYEKCLFNFNTAIDSFEGYTIASRLDMYMDRLETLKNRIFIPCPDAIQIDLILCRCPIASVCDINMYRHSSSGVLVIEP